MFQVREERGEKQKSEDDMIMGEPTKPKGKKGNEKSKKVKPDLTGLSDEIRQDQRLKLIPRLCRRT